MPPRTDDQWICLAFRVQPEFFARFVDLARIKQIEEAIFERLDSDDVDVDDTPRLVQALENLKCAREIHAAHNS